MKFFADGAIAGRSAWLKEPYVGSSEDFGLQVMSAEDLHMGALKAHRAGFQVCTHANGDAAIEMVLDVYEKIQAQAPRENARMRFEHCTVVSPSILKRLKALDALVTPFCSYVYFHGDKMKYYGEERLERMFAHRSFIDHGIVSTGASDYSPGPFEPLMGIQSCVTRTDRWGKSWGTSQKISVEEALELYTRKAAYASFEENIKGSLSPGKLGDLVVLGQNPLTCDPFALKDIPVRKTILGGRVVFEDE